MMSLFHTAISILCVTIASHEALAANCDTESFGVLATSPTVGYCMRDSNVPILALEAPPTQEQLAKICQTLTCRQMLKILLALNPVECNIPLGSRIRLRGDLMDPAVTYCASHSEDIASGTEVRSPFNFSTSSKDNETVQFPAVRIPHSSALAGWKRTWGHALLVSALVLLSVYGR